MILFRYPGGVDILRHVAFYVAVSDHRHFGHAADSLGIAQPPLSAGIKRLERHLGVRLFDRNARSVNLTEAGRDLLPDARQLLKDAADFELAGRTWESRLVARVGFARDLGSHIQGWVSLLSEEMPIHPILANSVDLVDRLRTGEIDMAIVRHPGSTDGLNADPRLLLGHWIFPASVLRDPEALIVLPPRNDHPPAHDQLIDALHRRGFCGEILAVDDEASRRAWLATGRAVTPELHLRPHASAPGRDFVIPATYRVLIPLDARRRAGVDCKPLVAALDRWNDE